ARHLAGLPDDGDLGPDRAPVGETDVADGGLADHRAVDVDRHAGADEVPHALVSPRALVRGGQQDEVAAPRDAAPYHGGRRPHHGGQARFHVARASAVDLAVRDLAAPGIARPARPDGTDVEVAVQGERATAAATRQPRDQAGPAGLALVAARLEPEPAEVPGQVLRRRGLVARWILCVEVEQLSQERDGLVVV